MSQKNRPILNALAVAFAFIILPTMAVIMPSAFAQSPVEPRVSLPLVQNEGQPTPVPLVWNLNPPTGKLIGGADISSIRLDDGSICWAASVSFPDRSFRVMVFRQSSPDGPATEVPIPVHVVGRGTLDRDADGVVLTAVGETPARVPVAHRVLVEGCR